MDQNNQNDNNGKQVESSSTAQSTDQSHPPSTMMAAFTDVFIKRPVFASVLSLTVILIGLISYMKLPLRQFPEIQASVVNVTTSYPGANAKIIESQITSPIENALAGIEGVDYIVSNSSQGISSISVNFKLGFDVNVGASEVSDKVSSARWRLPKEANDPVIAKNDPNADPIMYVAFFSETRSFPELTDYMTRAILPEIEMVSGVSRADNYANTPFAMRIILDPKRMAARKITADDVRQALVANNLQAATGKVMALETEYNVLAVTDLNNAEEFNNMVVKAEAGSLTRLRDIGYAELDSYTPDASVRFNGKPATVIGITPKSTANPLVVAKLLTEKLEILSKKLPEDITLKILRDQTMFISASIHEVIKTIFEAVIIVMAVVFLFLGSLRTLLIPTMTIPISLIGVMGLMLMMGFSLNTLTLLAFVLSIGMVVDDAIVVSENIHRHIELGKSRIQAAITGASEIRFAIVAMTITLAAVYAPIGFLEDLTGTLFREFAFTLAGAVIISGFVALTLSPMMCSKILPDHAHESKLERIINKSLTAITNGYRWLLEKVLKVRILVVGVMVAVMFLCSYLYNLLPDELAPKEDVGVVFAIGMGPAASNLAYTEKYGDQLGKIFERIPETLDYGIINGIPNGVNSLLGIATLQDWQARTRSVDEIIGSIMPELFSIPGMFLFATNPYALPGSGGGFKSVKFVIKTIGSYEELNDVLMKLQMAASQRPELQNLDVSLKIDRPQVEVRIDRDLAGDLGVSMSAISSSLNLALGAPQISRFEMNGRSYDVFTEVLPEYRDRPDSISQLYVHTMSGDVIPLSSLSSIHESTVPRTLEHFQQMRSATIEANPAPGYTLGQALAALKDISEEILPPTVTYDFTGESRSYVYASGALQKTFVYALIFIFLVLAAQFESFRAPLIILLSVPLATAGALATLALVPGGTMNIYTKIGLITLVGLISKHGILMVEFADQLRLEGRDRFKAIIEAACVRLRPILMTTAAMVIGAVPLVDASGAGAISRSQIGWVIIGGMTVGTIFTLFVVPAVYTYLAKPEKSLQASH